MLLVAAREPIRRPELSELETFVLAVEEGSIARAANRLRISTQAAAKRIRQLEVIAHDRLLTRTRRGVTATDAGARLYPIAREALAHRNRVIDALAGAPAPDPLRIAGMHRLIGATPAPPVDQLLRDTEAVMAAIFHASAEAIIVTRADDGLIYELNDAAVELFGYDQYELRGRTVFEVDLWEDPDGRNACVQRAISTCEPQQARLVLRTRDGSRRLVAARFEAIELHDTGTCCSRSMIYLGSALQAAALVAVAPATDSTRTWRSAFSTRSRAAIPKRPRPSPMTRSQQGSTSPLCTRS